MKKFYTVKEAAKILGFSTNTVYTHLEEGSLTGKRVGGRGRFKIPYSELAPYLETPNEENVGRNESSIASGAVMLQRVGIGWTVAGILFGVIVGYSALNFSMPKPITDIASATFDYSGRTSSEAGNMVETQVPKIGGSVKALAISVTSGFGFKNRNLSQNPQEVKTSPANQVMVEVPHSASINIRDEATSSAKILAKLSSNKVAEKIGEEGDWTKIAITNYPEGWVSNKFIETSFSPEAVLGASSDIQGNKVTINETGTGWLNLRNAPGGGIIGKVSSGETYTVLDGSDGWYFIEIPGSTNGWISSQYATLQ